jgi:protein-disulfide isomerase
MLPLAVAALALALTAGSVHAQTQDRAFLERADASRARGDDDAPVLVLEISDPQCPYCAQFSLTTFPRLDSAYIQTGRVQWVVLQLPMPTNRHAWGAAEAALCAGAIGDRFWEVRDRLFATQAEWSEAADAAALFLEYVREAGVAIEEYSACVRDDRVAPLIVQDVIHASTARVAGTPTFVINQEQVVVGAKGFAEWRSLLEAVLSR